MFDIGQMAVYPAHGVGVIESIEHRKVGESEQSFYVMKILKNNMVIMIPTATSKNVGLRCIISQKEVNEVGEEARFQVGPGIPFGYVINCLNDAESRQTV